MDQSSLFSYHRAMEKVLTYLQSENLRLGDRLPSERDFAELFQISRPTVNKALACLIAEGRLRREGYKLYVASSQPKPVESVSIGVLCPHSLNRRAMVSHNLVEAAHDVCEATKVRFTPMLSIDGQQQREQLLDLLKAPPSGIVIWPHTTEHYLDLFKQFTARNIPLVVNDLNLGPFDYVGVDNHQGMENIVAYLADLGHREVAYFTRKLSSSNLIQRCEGFQYATFKYLAVRSSRRIYELPGDNETGLEEMFERFLKEKSRVTAICCSHDAVALDLLRLCAKRSIRVPTELSIAGFDGIDAGAVSLPSLTTVDQDFYHLGALATELLIRRIRLKHIVRNSYPQHVHLTPHLIKRESVDAPPKSIQRKRRKRNISFDTVRQ